MTDDDRRKLRELAERARKPQGWKRIAFQAARLDEFREAASPDAILALLDERDAMRRERDEAQRQLEAELQGNAALRNQHGARPTETMFAFVERMVSERDAAMALLRKRDGGLRQALGALNICKQVLSRTGHEHAPFAIDHAGVAMREIDALLGDGGEAGR